MYNFEPLINNMICSTGLKFKLIIKNAEPLVFSNPLLIQKIIKPKFNYNCVYHITG